MLYDDIPVSHDTARSESAPEEPVPAESPQIHTQIGQRHNSNRPTV